MLMLLLLLWRVGSENKSNWRASFLLFYYFGSSWMPLGFEARRHNVIKMSHTFNNFMTATKS